LQYLKIFTDFTGFNFNTHQQDKNV
jgi:hypothetical protein